MADILFLEPFYGGSHKYFADGLLHNSRHNIRLLSLPGRFWKWRMESAGLVFFQMISEEKIKKPDMILTTNLMDLTQFKGLCGWHDIPYILYVHENQLDYPLSPGEKIDFHYVWKDYMNFLCADKLIFNSKYNLESFLEKFKAFSPRLPDCKPGDPSDRIRPKTDIIPPGCSLIDPVSVPDTSSETASESECASENPNPPVILWNQRWEHDKNPEAFFDFLSQLKRNKIPFSLIVLGESYKDSPTCFSEAKEKFKEEIIRYGYAESRKDYEFCLGQSDFVISTALQENFGISVVEAISAGAVPLLPKRLAYPEVLPETFHASCLYTNSESMVEKYLSLLSMNPDERRRMIRDLRKAVQPYSRTEISTRFDQLFDTFC